MKPGHGKAKGGQFEREVCVLLSKWVTNGKRKDVFWRSAMSGGRATVARGEVRQCGDICAVAPEGHYLAIQLFIECKHVKDCNIFAALRGKGELIRFWTKLVRQANEHMRFPVLIIKQNNRPTLWITCTALAQNLIDRRDIHRGTIFHTLETMNILFFDDVLKAKPGLCLVR